ncbi:MAG: DinB family protein [Gemmatimonadaceae bacterium]
MIRSIADFEQEWTATSSGSRKIFAQLTDASLSQAIAHDSRTLGRIAWHIVQSLGELPGRLGLKIDAPAEHAPVPSAAATIRDAYSRAADTLLGQVRAWSDADLATEDDMYGERWTRGFSLRVLLEHEIHHRGQMTVLMRQAGLSVPGLIGPAREDWAQWGMQPPAI